MRAEQVGWFPEYTITEDYALSMELKKAGCRGRYLPLNLVVSQTDRRVLCCVHSFLGPTRSCGCARGPEARGVFDCGESGQRRPLFEDEFSRESEAEQI